MLITRLLLILEVYSTKPTHTKSWARNFLMLDLTLGPSFKVKQWFTGFGELSFRWIQICIGLQCVGQVNLLVFGFLLVQFQNLDSVSGTPAVFFRFSFYLFINSNPRKIHYFSSLSCNPSTVRLDSAFSFTWLAIVAQ